MYLRLVSVIDVPGPAALLQQWAIAGIMSAILSHHRWIFIHSNDLWPEYLSTVGCRSVWGSDGRKMHVADVN